ncbi:MAG: glucose-6-phosphate dehydrogenase [Bacteroidales bacterium]
MQTDIQPHILIIFGGSGDLTKRKLIPALYDLFIKKLLPKQYAIMASGRTDFNDASFRKHLSEGLIQHNNIPEKESAEFLQNCYYVQAAFQKPEETKPFINKLNELDTTYNTKGNFIYYLSTPPSLYKPISENIGKNSLSKPTKKFPGWKRIIIEKPFGTNTETAQDLNNHLQSFFDENQIYRIDHYLGKETAQNILITRFYNSIFEPLWNRNYIHNIEITAAEQDGVGNRGGYYDSSGALRDMVQNHMLQLLALIAMEPPTNFNAHAIRNEILKVFESLRPLTYEPIEKQVIRGQYTRSIINNIEQKAYTQEDDVSKTSKTETFVALKCFIDNWRWGGVPIFIRTGKHLPARVSEIVITFKHIPHPAFIKNASGQQFKNQLIIRIQPDEGIQLRFGMKIPGIGFDVDPTHMSFKYSDKYSQNYKSSIPSAYERLLFDCMKGDPSLFTRADAVELAWKFVQPILDEWEHNPSVPLYGYPAGTWGPIKAQEEFKKLYGNWRKPCKNSTNSQTYCEL